MVGAAWVVAAAAVYGASEQHEARKEQKAANVKAEAAAAEAQEQQEDLALTEQKAADVKLEEQRTRMLKGQKGRGGLLFGSELGVEEKATTLGE